MSAPRQIVPGNTYMISRRCAQRQFLLSPSSYVAEVFLYCLTVAAERTGVIVHALTVMSNHYHLIATDPNARLPEFCAWLHEFVAKALNAHYGRWENFWSTEPTSYVHLVDIDDILDKTLYTLANPVAAGLVSHGDDWPGLRIFSPGRRRVQRPLGFFRAKGPTPESATLNIIAPPIGLPSNGAYDLIKEKIVEREAAIRKEFRATGKTFCGVAAIRAQRFTDVPSTMEPRRELSPPVACRNRWRRVEVLRRSTDFIRQYREALRAWTLRLGLVLFPVGTYQMRRRYGVAVSSPDQLPATAAV
jgi:putative transposase